MPILNLKGLMTQMQYKKDRNTRLKNYTMDQETNIVNADINRAAYERVERKR